MICRSLFFISLVSFFSSSLLSFSREGEGDVDLCRLGDLERLRCGDLERLLLRSLSLDLDLSRRLLSHTHTHTQCSFVWFCLANTYLVIFINFYSILVKGMFDSGNIKNLQHANTCILLSTCPSPSVVHIKSPHCLTQKCLRRLGTLVTHHWPQLLDRAWGKGSLSKCLIHSVPPLYTVL